MGTGVQGSGILTNAPRAVSIKNSPTPKAFLDDVPTMNSLVQMVVAEML
jgi:hypothetical protein